MVKNPYINLRKRLHKLILFIKIIIVKIFIKLINLNGVFLIKIKNLSKKYKVIKKEPGLRGAIKALYNPKYELVHAVNNINFSISEGEIVGYIGSNGAGKSTTIKMMSGILTPDDGEILVNGIIPYKNRKKCTAGWGSIRAKNTIILGHSHPRIFRAFKAYLCNT